MSAQDASALAAAFESGPVASVRPPWRQLLSGARRSRLAMAGLLIIGILTTVAVLAPVIAKEHPQPGSGIWSIHPADAKQPPSAGAPLGTDPLGRDLASRMIYGARMSLIIGMASVSLAIAVGMLFGALAGYYGGWVDMVVMRVMDVVLAFPSILLALAIVVILGNGLLNVMLAVGIVSIPSYARIVRSSVLGEVGREYVTASRALGASDTRILFRHVLPNAVSPLIVAASLGIGSAILDAAGLSFLGLGAQPPLAEWGLMLADYRQYLFTQWWLVLFPGIAIMLTVLGFNLLGDGLRDVLDPRLRGGRGA